MEKKEKQVGVEENTALDSGHAALKGLVGQWWESLEEAVGNQGETDGD